MSRLLIIADLEGENIAVARGLKIASKLGIEAHIAAFVYAPLGKLGADATARENIKKRLLDEREAVVQAAVDKHAGSEQRVKLHTYWEKDFVARINTLCERDDYQMVVKTGHRTESFARASSDWLLLRECPAPLLILAENKWRRTAPVMAALDLGTSVAQKKRLNLRVLTEAKALAEGMGEELEIICAVEVPALLHELDLVDPIAYVKDAKAEMAPHIAELAERLDIPRKAFHIKRGPVEKVIASQAAAKRAQIVVMGTVGRKGMKARLIGNTAERVLAQLKTDVLALKP